MSETMHYPMQDKIRLGKSHMVCGAKTRAGTTCKNIPVTGKNRCRMHGGSSPTGKNHWNFKHGYWSNEEKQQRTQMMRFMKTLISDADMY